MFANSNELKNIIYIINVLLRQRRFSKGIPDLKCEVSMFDRLRTSCGAKLKHDQLQRHRSLKKKKVCVFSTDCKTEIDLLRSILYRYSELWMLIDKCHANMTNSSTQIADCRAVWHLFPRVI